MARFGFKVVARMKILVAVKRVIDYAVKIRVKSDKVRIYTVKIFGKEIS